MLQISTNQKYKKIQTMKDTGNQRKIAPKSMAENDINLPTLNIYT